MTPEPTTAPKLPGSWTEPDAALVDRLTQYGCAATGDVVFGDYQAWLALTGAERERRLIRAAVRALLANGCIVAADPMPEWFIMTDPGSPRG